ncbi:MAG: hypothetical protein J6Y17_03270 [Elusimicrobiaceae bacterium]|nr:hypothetical protein [Elusimicrobiaceae bacterium]
MKKISYRSSFCEEVLHFFEGAAFHVTEVQKKDGAITLLETAAELPTFAAFAKKIGVTCKELQYWEEQHPAFKYACEQARDRQANILIQNSLRGNYAASFAIFTAKNLLGWKDGKESKENVQNAEAVVVSWEQEHAE